ncbi:MAG: UbiA family prenyltransferase [Thermoplasmatota archaeon]
MASYGSLWKARLRLLRPGNALMAALGVLVGMALALRGTGLDLELATWVAAPLAAALVTGFGNVLNDLGDLETDRRAHPERPLPGGELKVEEAKSFAALLLGLGLLEAFVAGGLVLLAFAGGVAALLGVYEWRLKAAGLPGNAAVALLVAATFPFGAVAVLGTAALPRTVWLLAAMAFLVNLARELHKDVEDAEGDAAAGRRTFVARSGAGAAQGLALLATLAAVALSGLAFLGALDHWPFLLMLGVADAAFLATAAVLADAARAQRLLKLGMLAALLGFLVLAVLPAGPP